jgi:hypothetical protein
MMTRALIRATLWTLAAIGALIVWAVWMIFQEDKLWKMREASDVSIYPPTMYGR